jgi:hypothetical protein
VQLECALIVCQRFGSHLDEVDAVHPVPQAQGGATLIVVTQQVAELNHG